MSLSQNRKDKDYKVRMLLLFLSSSSRGKEVNVISLEAVQKANKVFHVWICFSRAKHPAPASRQPALPLLCRRFHLGANTILRLSFSAHCHRREAGKKHKMEKLKGNE